MASSDPLLAHGYGPPATSRLSSHHLESELLSRPESVPYDHTDCGGPGTVGRGVAIPSGRSNGAISAGIQGPFADISSFDMAAAARNYTPEHRTLPLQQQSNVQHPHPQHCQSQSGLSSSGLGAATAPKPIRRRMRMITSCLECRRRKLKCNKSQPCTNCLKFSRNCLYLGPKLDEASQLRLTEIKEKVGSLERQLERDVAKSGKSAAVSRGVSDRRLYQQRILADVVEGELDEEKDLEITPMVALDLTYEDDTDGTDEVLDLGVQVGKMRLTEKIGGLHRPRISEEIQAGLSGDFPRLGGFSSGLASPGLGPGQRNQSGKFSDSTGSGQSMPDFLRPSASYVSPTSGVLFGQVVQSPAPLTFLPTKSAGDRLLEHYFDAVHPIARCVHRSCFQVQYETFWEEATAGFEPRTSVQAVVFAAWFSAAVAMEESVILREFGFTKANLVENMKIGTEVALSRANFLRNTKIETMQAFVMYMIPLCREEVSRAHSVLVGAAVRMAECMGLHRDGKNYNLNPLEIHVRRLIWHQLCFLDIRTCEAQGPKPAIRREDYDTWLPDNREEGQLFSSSSSNPEPHQPSEGWTSTLFPLIRFEVNEMMRIMWADRRKLESRKITLTQALTKIETFRKRMLASYDHLLDEHVPIQRYAKLVMHLLLYRLHIMVLHPYYANTTSAMPAQLRSVLVMSGIMIIELAMQLETNPAFRLWRWYAGAYQQYQAALILATEIHYHPGHKDAGRIWACLDFVFDLDDSMATEEKGRQVLMEIMQKMDAYMSMRKMRAPTMTAGASPAKQPLKSEGAIPRPRHEAADTSRPPTAQQTNPHMRSSNLPMKDEPNMASPPGPGSRSGSTFHVSNSGTPTSVSPQQQQQSLTGVGPSPIHPHSQHGIPGPNVVMASYSSMEDSWGLLPAPLNPGSPEKSSSDGGSVMNVGLRQGNLTGAETSMPGRVPPNLMDGGWSNYQEDAINALFPFDSRTGGFAGFGDPLTSGLNRNSVWTQPTQSPTM